MQILEGRSYRLQFPWIGVVNRSQQDINKSVDMIAARRRERDYFANTPEYKHLAHRMGSEHLAKSLSKVCLSSLMENMCYAVSLFDFLLLYMQHLESVIKSRIPGLQSLITKTIAELETELNRLGKPIANDAGVSLEFTYSLIRTHSLAQNKHTSAKFLCIVIDHPSNVLSSVLCIWDCFTVYAAWSKVMNLIFFTSHPTSLISVASFFKILFIFF